MNKHGLKICVFTAGLSFVLGFMTYHILMLIEDKKNEEFMKQQEQFDEDELDAAFDEDEEDSRCEPYCDPRC